ncbi:MAG: PIN domain-containing protein [Thiohalomonadales bacterium]
MTWLISDANIIIDMESGNILDKMFRLPENFAVPNILYSEELAEHHSDLPTFGLRVLEIREEFIVEAYRLGGVYRKPSNNDLLALALAKQEQCPLLTGDAKLREAADSEQVVVRGTLWLVERLFDENLLDYNACKEAYSAMKNEYRRLPWIEIDKQLKRFKKKYTTPPQANGV